MTRTAEADRLAALIGRNASILREGNAGPEVQLEGVRFRLFGRSRNMIYRVSAETEWFVKLPRNGSADPPSREGVGATAAAAAFAGRREYEGAAETRASADPAFVLASAIPGRPLNQVLFRRCWMPSAGAARELETAFAQFGTLMAVLHERAQVPAGTPPATTRPFEILRTMLDKAAGQDATVSLIEDWYAGHRRSDDGDGYIHGNLRMDNVLRSDTGVGFIDFENSGTGSFYQDLSRPVTELLLTRSAAWMPRGPMDRCIAAFLSAYGAVRPYTADLLWDFVGARVARYYLEVTRPGASRARIGGVPVLTGKLQRLTASVLNERPEHVMPQLPLRLHSARSF